MSMGLLLRSALVAGAKEISLLSFGYNLIEEYQKGKVEYFLDEYEKGLVSDKQISEAVKMDFFITHI